MGIVDSKNTLTYPQKKFGVPCSTPIFALLSKFWVKIRTLVQPNLPKFSENSSVLAETGFPYSTYSLITISPVVFHHENFHNAGSICCASHWATLGLLGLLTTLQPHGRGTWRRNMSTSDQCLNILRIKYNRIFLKLVKIFVFVWHNLTFPMLKLSFEWFLLT